MENPIPIYDNIPSAPVLRPSYTSSFENATKQFKKYWKVLFWVASIILVIEYVLSLPLYLEFLGPLDRTQFANNGPFMPYGNSGWAVLYQTLLYLIVAILFYGFSLVTLKAARSENPSIRDLFRPFKKSIVVIFSGILLFLIIIIGFILLIIPGIIFACKLIFVPYLVVDRNKGVFSAISESWKMTKGHFWKIFLIGLTAFAIGMIYILICLIILMIASGGHIIYGDIQNNWACSLIFYVLYLPFNIYFTLVISSLYYAVSNQNQFESPVAPAQPPVNLDGSNPSADKF